MPVAASSATRVVALLGAAGCALFAVLSSCTTAPQRTEKTTASSVENGSEAPNIETDAGLRCLPQKSADLAALIAAQKLAPRDGGPDGSQHLVTVSRGKPRWMAAFNAALAWQNGECAAFATFAELMGYEASEVTDTATHTRHWVLLERATRYNGTFVFRVPDEREQGRPLVITAPHHGSTFSDDRAVRLYRDAGGAVLLQASAHRCGVAACSSCMSFPGDACGGCSRASDLSNSVDHLTFAVLAGLAAVRKDLYFEYDDDGGPTAAGCAHGSAQVSDGADRVYDPAAADLAFPGRFAQAVKGLLGAGCACQPLRDPGCKAAPGQSVLARFINQESTTPFDPCTGPATRVSGRFLSFTGRGVSVETVVTALRAAVPMTAPTAPPAR